jgi:hypothetical protein
MSYTVTAEDALRWIANQTDRKRYTTLERRSKGGWGVWDSRDSCWVFVDMS